MMSAVVLACRVSVAVVFLLAVCGKVRSRAAFDEFALSLTGMRLVGARGRRSVARAVVLVESVVIALVVVPSTVLAGFLLAAGVSAALAAGLVVARSRGATESCRCFGVADGGGIGRATVARPVVLCGVAAVGFAARAADQTAPGGAALVAALLAGAIAALAVRGLGRVGAAVAAGWGLIRRRAQRDVAGARAPEDIGPGFDPDEAVRATIGRALPARVVQDPVASVVLSSGRPALLAFLSTHCGGCRDAAPGFGRLAAAEPGGRDAVLAVVSGPAGPAAAMARTLERSATTLIEPEAGPVTAAFDPVGLPMFVRVDAAGVIVVATMSLSELSQRPISVTVTPEPAGRG